jgi:hypothetical protein
LLPFSVWKAPSPQLRDPLQAVLVCSPVAVGSSLGAMGGWLPGRWLRVVGQSSVILHWTAGSPVTPGTEVYTMGLCLRDTWSQWPFGLCYPGFGSEWVGEPFFSTSSPATGGPLAQTDLTPAVPLHAPSVCGCPSLYVAPRAPWLVTCTSSVRRVPTHRQPSPSPAWSGE